MTHRTVVNGIISNSKGEIFICKKPKDRGVYPGQWAIPGGGIDPGETAQQALRREIKEETGLNIKNINPVYFYELAVTKYHPTSPSSKQQLILLVFTAKAASTKVTLDTEHEIFAWVKPDKLGQYDLNPATKKTLKQLGLL